MAASNRFDVDKPEPAVPALSFGWHAAHLIALEACTDCELMGERLQEREQLKTQEAAILAAEEARRKRVTVHIDLLGRQVSLPPSPTLPCCDVAAFMSVPACAPPARQQRSRSVGAHAAVRRQLEEQPGLSCAVNM